MLKEMSIQLVTCGFSDLVDLAHTLSSHSQVSISLNCVTTEHGKLTASKQQDLTLLCGKGTPDLYNILFLWGQLKAKS